MKQTMDGLAKDLAELQELMDQIDPTSTNPDDQIALKIFTHLIQQRMSRLEILSEAS